MNYVYAGLFGFAAGAVLTRLYYNKAVSAYNYIMADAKAGLSWVEALPSALKAKVKAAL